VESKLLDEFSSWGYREVRTPLFEYLDVLSKGVGRGLVKSMFKVQDGDGSLIAFRAEMTTPVARLVCSRLLSEPMPLKLCYVSNVVRFKERFKGYPREFWQAGVELIGCRGVEADAEVMALMIKSLQKLGLGTVKVDVGHAGIFRRLMALAELDEDSSESVKSYVLMKDSTGLRSTLERMGCKSRVVEAFEAVCRVRGVKVLDELRRLLSDDVVERYAEEVRELLDLLKEHGVHRDVTLDLSLIRGLDYYTGVIFEPYTSSFGRALGGGGRYDNLIEAFIGKAMPATGFALVVDYIVEAIGVERVVELLNNRRRILVVAKSRSSYLKAVEKASELRSKGFIVDLHPIGDLEGAQVKAERMKAELLVVDD